VRIVIEAMKKTQVLTEKQNEVFQYIKTIIDDTGLPPTVREIAERFSMTAKGAYDHLKAIEKKGFIRCGQNKSRAIEILIGKSEEKKNTVSIPLVGRIAAGLPVFAEENIEDYIEFPKDYIGRGEFFALSVKGDSMTGAGIFDGDIVLIKKQNRAENGNIVAALVEGEATLKTLQLKDSKVVLRAENPSYSPIMSDDVSIMGVLSGLMRFYH